MRQESCWRHVWSAVSYTACLWIFLAPQAYAKVAKRKISTSYPKACIASLTLMAPKQWKSSEYNGLEIESIQMRSQAAYADLASGDVLYVAGVGPNSVAATLRGLPSKAVWFA